MLNDGTIISAMPSQDLGEFVYALNPKLISEIAAESDETGEDKAFSLPALFTKLKEDVRFLSSSHGGNVEAKIAYLADIVNGNAVDMRPDYPEGTTGYHEQRLKALSAVLYKSALAHIVADELEAGFWDILPRFLPIPSTDMKTLDSRAANLPPIPAIRTSDILGVSDDDRLYWWDGSEDVQLSQPMESWLQEVDQEYESILSREGKLIPPQDHLQRLVTLAHRAYHEQNVILFEELFYEIIMNLHQREYQAFLLLLEAELERGGTNLKRLVALLANQRLRASVFHVSYSA